MAEGFGKSIRKNRSGDIRKKIKRVFDAEDIMIEIMSVLRELEYIPNVGNYYTFVYNAKTPGMQYDQHPLIATLGLYEWGFKGLNFHWENVDPSQAIRSYTWNEVAGSLHLVYPNEISYMRTIPYSKFRINR
jgi:hypothetical protein|tara:strand:- start:184 stop:579 length:396 start_codon:yes stop_codon:yes gene_type:complete